MPLWAILYTGLLLASAAGTIMISRSKSPLYIVAELLSGIFAVSFFLFYYEVVAYPSTIMIVVMMLAFILFQEIWVNRKLYGFIKDDQASKEENRIVLFFTAVIFLLFLSPFIWVVIEVFKHFS
jgi:hypothetical protein